MNSPKFSVRFYIRTKQSKRGEELTPLRIKVWVGATKSYLYMPTDIQVTPWQWSAFASDGTPTTAADPKLAKAVDRYHKAATMVISSAIVNNRINTLTSAAMKMRVDGVKTRMEANEKSGANQTIMVFAAPSNVPTCAGCAFGGDKCRAPWIYDFEADTAPDLAAFNGLCRMRVEAATKQYQPTPGRAARITNETTYNFAKRMEEAAAAIEAEKGEEQ